MKKEIMAFGTGEFYLNRRDSIKNEYDIKGFYDNDETKWGTQVDGIVVHEPKYPTGEVLITTSYKYEIISQLLGVGTSKENIYVIPDVWMKRKNILPTVIDSFGGGIRIQYDGVCVDIHSPTEEGIFKEIFYCEDYNFVSPRETVVIDIGMNVGLASLFFASKDYVKNVYSFEPDKRVYDKAIHNIKLNSSLGKKIKTFNIALGSQNVIEQYVDYDDESAGIRKIRNYDGDEAKYIKVECVDAGEYLKPIIQKHKGIEDIVIKCDCEGAEYDILYRLEQSGLIEHITGFVMEWHISRRGELEDFFKRNEYKFIIFDTPETTMGKCYAFK